MTVGELNLLSKWEEMSKAKDTDKARRGIKHFRTFSQCERINGDLVP